MWAGLAGDGGGGDGGSDRATKVGALVGSPVPGEQPADGQTGQGQRKTVRRNEEAGEE